MRLFFSYIFFFLIVFFLGAQSLHAQPVTTPKKTKHKIYSDAQSVFTKFKDRRFSNYKYFDELKNMELNADVFAGYSMSLTAPRTLYGLNYGLGFTFDYYFRKTVAIRTGIKVRGSNLFRTVPLDVVNTMGDTIARGKQSYQVSFAQVLIPIHFLFTQFRYNRGLWVSFGVDLGVTLQGVYNVKNTATMSSGDLQLPNDKRIFFETNEARQTYFRRFAAYADIAIGYKFSRKLNLYGQLQIATNNLENVYTNSLNNHSLTVGAMFSLWQY